MSIAGAAFGASQSLEQILAEQMLKAKMAQQQQQEAAQLALQTRQVEGMEADRTENRRIQGERATLEGIKYRDEQAEKATNRNIGLDAANVLNMPGMTNEAKANEFQQSILRNPNAPSAAGMTRMVEGLTKKPEKVQYTYTDPKSGNRTLRFANKDEVPEGGLDMGNEPQRPAAGPAPDYEWVVGKDGQPRQIRKGTAQPGDRPYTGTMSRDETARNVAGAKRDAYFEDAIEAIKELQTTAGQAGATGMPSLTDPGSWTRALGMDAIAGSPAAVYDAKRKAVISKVVVPRLEAMRGLGQMSDREFANMVAGATALAEGRLSEEAETAELARLLKFLEDRGGIEWAPGAPKPEPKPEPKPNDPLGLRP